MIDPVDGYLSGLTSPRSRETQRSVIRHILCWLAIEPDTTMQEVPWERLLTKLILSESLNIATSEGKSISYHNNILAAFRGMARVAYATSLIDANQLAEVLSVAFIPVPQPIRRPVLNPNFIKGLIDFCLKEGSLAGLRDACIFGIAFSTGLQRRPLITLNIENFIHGTRYLSYFRYTGTDDIELEKFVPEEAQHLLRKWLQARANAGANPNAGRIFYAIDQFENMRISDKGMTTTGLHDIVVRRSKAYCNIKMTLHDFRRSIITWLLDEGHDPTEVALWSGHSDMRALVENYHLNKSRSRHRVSSSIQFLKSKRDEK